MAAPDHTSEHAALPGPEALTSRFNAELERFLDGHTRALVELHPDLGMLADASRAAVLVGGKRLRPTFVYWGWRTVQPSDSSDEGTLIRAAASLELLQACALVHDDVMDSSNTRRGQAAAHIRFADQHCLSSYPGNRAAFGTAGAILLGDLLLSWAEEMFTGAIHDLSADRAAGALREFDQMRTEVVGGQFLDLLAQTRGKFDPAEALRVIEFKTSRYTIQRPLLIGASAAGAAEDVQRTLYDYGHALGEAFQLRDDLLGVFGDPSQTGKPAGDDLREGKRTLLVALAAQAADRSQRSELERGVGNPDLDSAGVTRLRDILSITGARRAVEQRIIEQTSSAERTLDQLKPEARMNKSQISVAAVAALTELAQLAAHRTS